MVRTNKQPLVGYALTSLDLPLTCLELPLTCLDPAIPVSLIPRTQHRERALGAIKVEHNNSLAHAWYSISTNMVLHLHMYMVLHMHMALHMHMVIIR